MPKYSPALQRFRAVMNIDFPLTKGGTCARVEAAYERLAILGSAGVDVPASVMDELLEVRAAWENFARPQIRNWIQTLLRDDCAHEASKIVDWYERTLWAEFAET